MRWGGQQPFAALGKHGFSFNQQPAAVYQGGEGSSFIFEMKSISRSRRAGTISLTLIYRDGRFILTLITVTCSIAEREPWTEVYMKSKIIQDPKILRE